MKQKLTSNKPNARQATEEDIQEESYSDDDGFGRGEDMLDSGKSQVRKDKGKPSPS